MNSEFFAALDELEQKRGISKEYMIEKIEAALVAAYKKEYGNNTNVRISIDENKKDVRVFQQKTIVAEVEDPETEISLEEAKLRNKRSTVGKILEFELKPKNFRRLSAGAARSVIIQAIREAERKIAQEAYEAKRE
ncbi:MAG: transcription termination/antitermination protein NusA, partial [Clostridia bacterium]|nr:transcription termination/antitermination protein NusA [Clostridia bacterium]